MEVSLVMGTGMPCLKAEVYLQRVACGHHTPHQHFFTWWEWQWLQMETHVQCWYMNIAHSKLRKSARRAENLFNGNDQTLGLQYTEACLIHFVTFSFTQMLCNDLLFWKRQRKAAHFIYSTSFFTLFTSLFVLLLLRVQWYSLFL